MQHGAPATSAWTDIRLASEAVRRTAGRRWQLRRRFTRRHSKARDRMTDRDVGGRRAKRGPWRRRAGRVSTRAAAAGRGLDPYPINP